MSDEVHDRERLLGIYLDDHRAGATGGVGLARRFHRANRDSPLGADLADLVGEIEEDRDSLDDVIERLGQRSSRIKRAGAAIAVVAASVKSNGRIRRYSPVSRLEEFEALSAGISTKASLWRTLGVALAGDARVAGIDFEALEQRAVQQLHVLEAHRQSIVAPLVVSPQAPGAETDRQA